MKKRFITIAAVCVCFSLSAQTETSAKQLYHYIFPEFMPGMVKQKSGEINNALLNYNTLTEEMIFEQSGQQMALDKTENIDTVYIANKRFIPWGNVFYEVATNTAVALFLQHKSTIIPPGNETGFGTSQTSAITNITDIKNSGMLYKLKLPDEYKLKAGTVYWLKKNGTFINFKNGNDVENIFPEKSASIKKFIKEHKINFKNTEDVTKLILFCNS